MSATAIDQDAWREALLADLAHEAALLPGRRLTSIFFGGGTPSLMEPATVAAMIAAARAHWQADDDIEITLEANPSSVEAARFADLAAAGVNRVSLGLQSLDDAPLAFLGRAHSVSEGLAALDIAQRHFDAGQLRPDLRASRPEPRGHWDGDARPRARPRHRPSVALPADHRAGHALRDHGRQARFEPLDVDPAADTVRADRRSGPRRPACPPMKSATTPGPARRAATTSLTGAIGDYAGVGPGAHGRRLGQRTVRHKKPENFLAASPATATAWSRKSR